MAMLCLQEIEEGQAMQALAADRGGLYPESSQHWHPRSLSGLVRWRNGISGCAQLAGGPIREDDWINREQLGR